MDWPASALTPDRSASSAIRDSNPGRPPAMTITIGTLSFDNVEYNADADVLYLNIGEPRMPAESFGTPEGHNIRYDETGEVIAITIVNAKWLLDRDGEIKLTIPSRVP